MSLQSNTLIFISGLEINAFKSVTLNQEIGEHHVLELVCRMDVLEDLSQALGESSKNFLGETLSLQTTSLDALSGYETLEFKGIVTQVKTTKGHDVSSGDSIVIKAQSPSFIADDGPHYASHNDVTLSEIVQKTFKDYDKSKLELLIQPKKDALLHYSVQHNESAYNYIRRLAAQYGEWFYYNGSKLVFGTPDTNELELNYGFDLKEYDLNLAPQSHNYKYFANDYLLDEVHEKDAKDVSSGANGYTSFVSSKADKIFNKETKVWHNLYNDKNAKQRLDASIESQKKAIEINQVQLSGVSDNPGVTLGSIIKIESLTYRITKVTHTNNENGDYQNRFKAVTAEFDIYPKTNISAYPKSETQTAIVMENADPEGLGRIRVQMPWQKIVGEMTPWIRMVTPHAGGDKGFHFIPEINEEVLIGFEGGNAEHPYMLGSLYNGTGRAAAFKNDDNNIKAIRTRSGHTIELNDKNGEESIVIYDKKGNEILLDTKEGRLRIYAPEEILLESKVVTINAEEKIRLQSNKIVEMEAIENNIMLKAGEQLVANAKVISSNAENEFKAVANNTSIGAKSDLILNGKGKAVLTGGVTEVQGKANKLELS